MKRIKTILVAVIIIITSTVFQSCSSDDNDDNPSTPETYIRFTINNTNYEFTDIITAASNSITLNGNNGAGILDAGDTQLAVWLPLTVNTGTFQITGSFDDTHKISFTSASLAFDFDFANNGSITITEATSQFITGTFTATVTNSNNEEISIASGEFKGSASSDISIE